MIISFVNPKGGTGKTTLAVSVATEWKERGREVRLFDADPLANARRWLGDTGDAGGPLQVTEWKLGASLVYRGLDQRRLAVVDTPPRHPEVRRAVLELSDIAIIPCGTSVLDVWGTHAAIQEITDLNRSAGLRILPLAVINRKVARSSVGEETRASLYRLGIPVLQTEVGQRVAFQELPARAAGVTHFAHASHAAEEIRALVDEVDERVRDSRRMPRGRSVTSYNVRKRPHAPRFESLAEARAYEKATVYEPVVSGCW